MPDTQPRLPPVDNREALRRTVQEFPSASQSGGSFTLQIATAADEAPAWWSPRRDDYLDKFWPTESYLAGAVYSIASRNASFRYELTGPDRDVWWAQKLLTQADFGQGWQGFIMKLTTDLLTAGNGAFFEVIRPAKAQTKDTLYDAIMVQSSIDGVPMWMPFDTHTGKILDNLVQDEDFKLIDTPFSLPIGLAHLDSHKCLGRDSRVTMADGSTKSIMSLVRNKSNELVLSVDKSGHLVPKKIVGWHETQLNGRYWLQMQLSHAQRTYGRTEKLWLTNDHEVLTPDGWTKAEELCVGDLVTTNWPDFSDQQLQVLVGSMLGDACITWSLDNGMPAISLTQCTRQEQWLDVKVSAFRNLHWSNKRFVGKLDKSHVVTTGSQATPALDLWRDAWYPNRVNGRHGKKRIPRELVKRYFSPLMLATWYMDDGNLQKRARWGRPAVRLYTNDFSFDDVSWLAELLIEHGYNTHVYSMRVKSGELQYYIYLTPDASEKFFDTVSPYIVSCMRYKLPDGYQVFNPELWDAANNQSGLFSDTVASIERGYNGGQTATFCIDVEDEHSFIAAGIVVHNCVRTGDPMYPVVYTDLLGQQHKLSWYQVVTLEEMPSPRQEMNSVQHCAIDRCLRLAQILRDMLIYKQEKVSGRFARAVHITNADARQLQDAIDQANSNADDRGLMRYMQPIIMSTVDPSSRPEVATIQLATLPDGFSEDDTMRWTFTGISNAFGVDYGYFSPLPGNKLGTSTQAETQERQSKGKSSRLFMQLITHKFNYSGLLPRTVQFQFAVADPQEESEKDRAQASRMRSYQTMIQSGLLPIAIVQQIASDNGDIDPKYLDLMGLTDLTPIVTIGSSDIQRVTRHRAPRVSPEQLQLQMPQPAPQPAQPRPGVGNGGNGNGDSE